jgi:ferredoxin
MSHWVSYQDGTARVQVAEDDFILDALLDADIDHPYSCRQGICTTCRVRLISGAIEHDPDEECLLSQAQINAGFRLLCVGQARADSMIEIA